MDVERESIEFDVLFVCGGPASLAGAIKLMQLAQAPTALVMANDMMALGAYQAAAELDLRIPLDVSVVGIDDNYFVAYVSPPLTTVHVPTRELGRVGLRMLAETPNADAPLRRATLPTALVVRQSTAPHRGQQEAEAQ